ncbi:uncharacterized protein [Nicotiana tomentosiformis]|uniref:uncharacterized protein n=1 Tax=Nicotiana tomentosiformis TaxID=4098 RepID=UPI00388C6392
MTKAYERLSWLFLTKVLRKMGFGERFIGLVFGIISNKWYSVLLNGQPYGFFKSSRGVKQGYPLSPTLFILASEALSRGLNALHSNLYFCGFGLPKWSPKINHLVYANDTIIFSSSDATSLRLVMEVLSAYESASGQLINTSKSVVYLHHSAPVEVVNIVERIIGFTRQYFPFTYLGCPIFYTRRKMDHYQGLLTKVMDKLQAWKGLGALYFIVPPDFVINDPINNVYEMVQDGVWDLDRLMEVLPEDYAVHIMENIKPPVPTKILDKPYWKLETRGELSVKSAWEYLRRRNEPALAYSKIWVKGLPFKISFFLWKVWKAKLPLDDWMRRLGYFMPSKCWCCAQPDQESLLHIFFTSAAATRSLVKLRKPAMQNVPHKWPDLIRKMEQYTPDLKVTKVIWECPIEGWIKVNTDGASRGNSERSSIGFVVRDEEGDVIYVLGKEIPHATNNEAEALAIVDALKYCVEQGFTQIILQNDSMLMKNVLKGKWVTPWNISEYMEESRNIMEGFNVRISHIVREGNNLVDHLANYALDIGDIEASCFAQLDSLGRKIMNSDKSQCPYMRVKAARN